MELGTEKSATQKLESGKLVLERQNKELKAKLAELETAARTKTKVGDPMNRHSGSNQDLMAVAAVHRLYS